ncbi:MAG: AMP-binding protein, partial [Neisseriaceae bacterium]|nr:AMP-binding protein [Neisseriaceae bacterium]
MILFLAASIILVVITNIIEQNLLTEGANAVANSSNEINQATKNATTGLFLTVALICLISGVYSIFQVPHLFTRILLLPILKTNYRFNVDGLQNLPQRGGVLLLGNHISWIDWLVLQAASPRAIKFVMYRGIYNKKYLTWLFKFFNVIPIGKGASKDSFTEIRTRLENGEVVALFPEGHISYNGQINEFQKGYELAIQDMENICIVPFYLRGLWGSSFSRAESYYKMLTKKHNKRDIIVAFGKPINRFTDHIEMKQKVVELSFSSWEHFLSRQQPFMNNWLANVKNDLFKTAAVDSTGMNLNNLKFATGVFSFVKVFKQLLEKEETVGVLLPGSTAAAIVNMALFIMGKVPVNLNYTLNPQSMEAALKKASINKIITSEKFLTKLEGRGFSFKELLDGKTIYAEQVGSIISKGEKIKTLLAVLLLPTNLLKLIYFTPTTLDDTATILFSSGSEGEPKGIELSHKNILANIKQISDLINFKKSDAILNSLPMFHSFGLTVTTLMPLCEGLKMISVPDPTDGAAIGKMAAQHHATVIFGTSTFFRLYARNKKLHPLMFQSVRLIVAGAEKLKPEVKE